MLLNSPGAAAAALKSQIVLVGLHLHEQCSGAPDSSGFQRVRELLMLQDANGDRAEAKRIARKQLEKIRHQIQSLSRIEAVLSETLKECSGEGPMDGCPIVEAIAQQG